MRVAHAAKRPREGRKPWLTTLAALLATASASVAQDAGEEKADAPARKGQEAPAAPPSPAEALRVEPQFWAEPNRFELLENDFEEHTATAPTAPERERIAAMVAGRQGVEPPLIRKFVAYHGGELTRRSSIEGLLQPDEATNASRGAKAMEEAAAALLGPLIDANTAASFRRAYVAELVAQAPKFLKGHLHTRTFYLTVLSRARTADVAPLLAEQIADEDQAHTVKLLAAVGLADVARRQTLEPVSQAIPAARAISGYLEANPETFWLIQVRMLEALGAIRTATANPIEPAVEFTDEAFALLSDTSQRPEVRAQAGWALGMLNLPAQIRQFNYELVAYQMGRAAAAIGDRIVAVPIPEERPDRNLRIVPRLADPLLKLLAGFVGEEEIRGSGLSRSGHPEAVNAAAMIRDVEQRVRAVATSALALSRSVGGQVSPAHRRLADDVQELKSFLAQNRPQSTELYPGGPGIELPPAPATGGSRAGSRPAAKPAAETKKGGGGGASR